MMPWTRLRQDGVSRALEPSILRELLGIEGIPARVLEETRLQVGVDR